MTQKFLHAWSSPESCFGRAAGEWAQQRTSDSGAIVIDGDRASGHTYTDEFNTDTEGNSERWLNRYDDEWIKRDDRWYFASLSLEVLKIRPA